MLAADAACFAAAADDGAALRPLYRQTAAAIARGDRSALARSGDRLRGYPLFAALELADLRSRLTKLQSAEVDAFLEKYAGQRPAEQLRLSWIARLASEQRWQDYLRYQPDAPTDPSGACTHAWATWRAAGPEAADPLLARIWLSPRSLPKSCDTVLAAWSARGHPDADQTWLRFDLAMAAGETALARYLQKRLSGAHRRDSELYLQLHEQPRKVGATGLLRPTESRHSRIAAHALLRLAASDAETARRAFEQLARGGILRADAQREVAPRIALGLAASSPELAAKWSIGIDPAARSDTLASDALRYALRAADWSLVDAVIAQALAASSQDARWLYWSGRAAARRDAESGREALQLAGVERSWYGFLASDRLGVPYSMQNRPVGLPESLRSEMARHPGILRAREYELIGNELESRREWYWLIQHLDNREREAAAAMAAGWGWHTQAISALAQAASWDDLGLRFPAPFSGTFADAARKQRLEPQWLYAIARQESAMNASARSPAGALGLMQVMPATARLTAQRSGMRFGGPNELLNPATNVAIGSRYMRMMIDSFGGNRMLAAAAYNAGPGRVRQWVGRFPEGADHDVFVEAIPFKETRQYVQNVMTYAVIYAFLQGGSAPLVRPDERHIAPANIRAG